MFRCLDLSVSLFGPSCFVVWILMFHCLDLNVVVSLILNVVVS